VVRYDILIKQLTREKQEMHAKVSCRILFEMGEHLANRKASEKETL
jgi:hypothetical protein